MQYHKKVTTLQRLSNTRTEICLFVKYCERYVAYTKTVQNIPADKRVDNLSRAIKFVHGHPMLFKFKNIRKETMYTKCSTTILATKYSSKVFPSDAKL